MIGRVDHHRVIGEPEITEGRHDTANVMVDQRDHAVVIGNDLPELFVGLVGDARIVLANLSHFLRYLGNPLQARLML